MKTTKLKPIKLTREENSNKKINKKELERITNSDVKASIREAANLRNYKV